MDHSSGRRVAAAVAIACLTVIIAATPASAHQTSIAHSGDTALLHSDHKTLTVCDLTNDGHAARAEIVTWEGGDGALSDFWEVTGSGCSGPLKVIFSGVPAFWRLCKVDVSCSTWRSV